ncbi:MAG: GDSL-type esterase/lipase family protein [Edaphobacter sp.]|uniref:SGNH/GDSL hydrolase family protein n=1 Tax=Edaphobacter sp. TaxID=1934404 RepID=UPI00238A6DC4|nr:GDSL-type esterase/lipase family protein [Edaphobacter sp.]MDE1175742.1 GDSL-type esterase/lipase family protein [Edaphobacter sp.]
MRKRRFIALSLVALCAIPALCCASQAAVRVVNDGVPGESSAEVDLRLDKALTQYHPQAVVIFVGMNDAVNDKKFLPVKQTAEHVSSMVKRSRDAGATVVIVLVHEPDTKRLLQRHNASVYGDVSPEERIRRLDDALEHIAHTDKMAVADFHAALIRAGGPTDELSTDGVHLTAKGYALLAETVRSALPSRMRDTDTVLCMGDSLTYGIGVRAPGVAAEGKQTYPAQLQRLFHQERTAGRDSRTAQ